MDINKLSTTKIKDLWITIELPDGTIIENDKNVIKRFLVCMNVLSGIDTDLLLVLDGVTTPEERCKQLKQVLTKLCKTHGKKSER